MQWTRPWPFVAATLAGTSQPRQTNAARRRARRAYPPAAMASPKEFPLSPPLHQKRRSEWPSGPNGQRRYKPSEVAARPSLMDRAARASLHGAAPMSQLAHQLSPPV